MPLLQYCKSESGFTVTFHTLNFSQTTSLVLREEDQAESVGLRICFLYYSPYSLSLSAKVEVLIAEFDCLKLII